MNRPAASHSGLPVPYKTGATSVDQEGDGLVYGANLKALEFRFAANPHGLDILSPGAAASLPTVVASPRLSRSAEEALGLQNQIHRCLRRLEALVADPLRQRSEIGCGSPGGIQIGGGANSLHHRDRFIDGLLHRSQRGGRRSG